MELYNEVVKCVCQMIRSCKDASAFCQTEIKDGYKRMYQTYAFLYEKELEWLKKKVFDLYRVRPKDDHVTVAYNPGTFHDHFTHWTRFMENSIKTLGMLNKQIYDSDGIPSKSLKALGKIICKACKDYERVCRDLKIYTDTKWNEVIVRERNDFYHAKFKCYMEKLGIS